jgi:hypothetical protein
MIELVSSQPSTETEQRIIRMMTDAKVLAELSAAQARSVYKELEETRDVLSLILDRADGKFE